MKARFLLVIPTAVAALAALFATDVLAAASPPPAPDVVEGHSAPAYRIAAGKGTARLLLTAETGSREASVSVLGLDPGAEVPEHVHDGSAELLYLEAGTVEMTIDGRKVTAGAGDAIRIPAGTRHSARVLGGVAVRAVQIYVGPGPEQRFAKGQRVEAR